LQSNRQRYRKQIDPSNRDIEWKSRTNAMAVVPRCKQPERTVIIVHKGTLETKMQKLIFMRCSMWIVGLNESQTFICLLHSRVRLLQILMNAVVVVQACIWRFSETDVHHANSNSRGKVPKCMPYMNANMTIMVSLEALLTNLAKWSQVHIRACLSQRKPRHQAQPRKRPSLPQTILQPSTTISC
jgi:hypothetical protein